MLLARDGLQAQEQQQGLGEQGGWASAEAGLFQVAKQEAVIAIAGQTKPDLLVSCETQLLGSFQQQQAARRLQLH